jgi:hypothetical protein
MSPEPQPPKRPTWQTFALIGFIAGVLTVILVVLTR